MSATPEEKAATPSLFPAATSIYSGTLLHNAEARSRPSDAVGHMVPVLCMDVALDCAWRNHAHFEQAFPLGSEAQCEAAARRFKKGMHVTLHAPISEVRLVVPTVEHIHIHPTAEATA